MPILILEKALKGLVFYFFFFCRLRRAFLRYISIYVPRYVKAEKAMPQCEKHPHPRTHAHNPKHFAYDSPFSLSCFASGIHILNGTRKGVASEPKLYPRALRFLSIVNRLRPCKVNSSLVFVISK